MSESRKYKNIDLWGKTESVEHRQTNVMSVNVTDRLAATDKGSYYNKQVRLEEYLS